MYMMEEKKRKNVSHTKIYDFWCGRYISSDGEVYSEKVSGSVPVIDDAEYPRCWACGKRVKHIEDSPEYQKCVEDKDARSMYRLKESKSFLNRCHIVPFAFGGSDEPNNLFLLCEKCHSESPDTDDYRNFLMWVYQKRQEFLRDLIDFDLWGMIDKVTKLCEEQGKDPYSGNLSKMANINIHGGKISEASIIYAYVNSCQKLAQG